MALKLFPNPSTHRSGLKKRKNGGKTESYSADYGVPSLNIHRSHSPQKNLQPREAELPPVGRTVVLDLLIEHALKQPDPDYELHCIQSDPRFSDAKAQQDFCETLCLVERRHFERLLHVNEYTPEFLGALENRGAIFNQFNQNQIPSSSITEWLNLLTDELHYLKGIKNWSDQDRELAIHVFELTAALTIYAPDNWISGHGQVSNLFTLLTDISQHIFDSSSPDLLPDKLESKAFISWMELCAFSENPLLVEEVTNEFQFVFNTWYHCAILADEDSEDTFDLSFPSSDTSERSEDASTHYAIEELEEWRSASNSENEDENEAGYYNAGYNSQDDHSLEAREQWENALSLVIVTAHGKINFDEEYLKVINNADLGSELWQAAFDGLLLSSYKESKEIVEGLVNQFRSEKSTINHIISLLDAPSRLTHELYFDTTELLATHLAALSKREKNAIVKAMRHFIAEQRPLLDDLQQVDKAFSRLVTRLKNAAR